MRDRSKNPLLPECGGFDIRSNVPKIVDDVKAPEREAQPVEQHDMFYMEGAGGYREEPRLNTQ